MSTHTPCPQCREIHTPRAFSYDGFGVNSCGMYRGRLATFSQSMPDAQRKELGALWVAAPAMLEALRGCERVTKAWLADMKDYPLINPEKAAATMELARIQEAIRLAEGRP